VRCLRLAPPGCGVDDRLMTREQKRIAAGILACLNCGDGGGLDGLDLACREALERDDWRRLADYLAAAPAAVRKESGVE